MNCLNCDGSLKTILSDVFDTRFGIKGLYSITQCQKCGLVQAMPRPSSNELKELYERYYNFSAVKQGLYNRLRQWFYQSPLYSIWLAIDGDIAFHRYKGTGRLLDVGCNEGRGLEIFRQNGFDAEGLELNENAVKIAQQRGFKVYPSTIENFIPEKMFDVVVISNVLEHALDPKEMLKNIHRVLNQGGKVLISCPNQKSLLRKIFKRYWINWHIPFHISHFDLQTMTNMLQEAGFDVVQAKQDTPALWSSMSLLAWMFAKQGQPVKLMRNPLLVMSLLVISRCVFFPLWWMMNSTNRGDCLVVIASKK